MRSFKFSLSHITLLQFAMVFTASLDAYAYHEEGTVWNFDDLSVKLCSPGVSKLCADGWQKRNVAAWGVFTDPDEGKVFRFDPSGEGPPGVVTPAMGPDGPDNDGVGNGILASSHNAIFIRMASNAADGQGRIYFSHTCSTGDADYYSDNKRIDFTIKNQPGGSAPYQDYIVSVGAHPEWKNTICQFTIEVSRTGSSDPQDAIGIALVKFINSINDNTVLVSLTGTGNGVVTGPGIDCGTDCQETYIHGTPITLSANPAVGSTFTGWGGDGAVTCKGTGDCNNTVDSIKPVPVTANFTGPATLNVKKSGSGSGIVRTISTTEIDCGSDCQESYTQPDVVTLNATPSAGSVFIGWSGACSGAGNCIVTMSASRNVTARFDLTPPPTVRLAVNNVLRP